MVNGLVKKDVFYGAGGIRGVFGKFPITLRSMVALGQAIGLMLRESGCQNTESVLIVCDTRESCEPLKEALAFGLSLQQVKVLDAGVLPTPAAEVLLRLFSECELAIVISASHNTFEYNGLKIFSRFGKINQEQIEQLNRLFEQMLLAMQVQVFTPPKVKDVKSQAHRFYTQHLVQQFSPNDFGQWSSVVLDCANGTASLVAPNVFAQLGIKHHLINYQPTGQNVNHRAGSTYPQALVKAVQNNCAAIGFAFDGDADRVIAADFYGKIKDGDDFLAIFSQATDICTNGVVVGTIMSNSGLEHFLHRSGKQFIRAGVGEASLIKTAKEHAAMVAGEPSGHILLEQTQESCDGIEVALKCLKYLQKQQNFSFNTFPRFFSQLSSVTVASKLDLNSPLIIDKLAHLQQDLGVGRIVLRNSETEPVLRVLVEAQDEVVGKRVSFEITKELALLVNKIEQGSSK